MTMILTQKREFWRRFELSDSFDDRVELLAGSVEFFFVFFIFLVFSGVFIWPYTGFYLGLTRSVSMARRASMSRQTERSLAIDRPQ